MELVHSYHPHYLSPADILATQERVPCQLQVAVPRLGFLDPASASPDLAAGTILELPLWLAQALSGHRLRVVSVELPRAYRQAHRHVLVADASVVDLHRLAAHFYESGRYVASLEHRDGPLVGAVLVQTFRRRFRQLLDQVQNRGGGEDPAAGRLDALERDLLRQGARAAVLLHRALHGDAGAIAPSDMVVSHRKWRLAGLDI